jgi:hypothetical protein
MQVGVDRELPRAYACTRPAGDTDDFPPNVGVGSTFRSVARSGSAYFRSP